MPNQTNLSTKKWDGTTAVTLTATQPSSGTAPAVWYYENGTPSKAFRPILEYSVRRSATGKAARGLITLNWPVVDSTVPLAPKIVSKALFEVRGVIPDDMSETEIKDALAVLATALLPAAGSLGTAFATGTGTV